MAYVKARNQLKREVRKAKRNLEKTVAKEAKANPKGFWKFVNSKLSSGTSIGELEDEHGSLTSDDKERAEILSKFFTSTFTVENLDELPTAGQETYASILEDMEVEQCEVRKLLLDLNPYKAAGIDGIHPRILKETAEILAAPLASLFKKSLDTGEIPEDWKSANITPIHKKGPRKWHRTIGLSALPR